MDHYYHEEEALKYTKNTAAQKCRNAVFLLGDSMRMGYCEVTKRELADVADVYFPEDNCRYTQYTYVNLSVWKSICPDPLAVKVVFWNNGHWDIAHWDGDAESLNGTEQYARMLVRISEKLRKLFPNAKIVFQTTLPMNPAKGDWINDRTTEEILLYNKAAVEALGQDIYIDDAFALFENKSSDYFADYCHLTPEGFEILGKHVAKYITELLDQEDM